VVLWCGEAGAQRGGFAGFDVWGLDVLDGGHCCSDVLGVVTSMGSRCGEGGAASTRTRRGKRRARGGNVARLGASAWGGLMRWLTIVVGDVAERNEMGGCSDKGITGEPRHGANGLNRARPADWCVPRCFP
jgi:hypothetical protein